MCAPAALGAASFASGALGAVGKYQSASAQASAQNNAAINNYKYQLKLRDQNWLQTRTAYATKVSQFQSELGENSLAASKAYAGAQNRLNEVYRQAAFRQQGMLSQLMQRQGLVTSTGMRGKSADRAERAVNTNYGLNMATQAASLQSAQNAFGTQTRSIRDQLRSQNNKAYSSVALAPQIGIAPPPPTMAAGPSGFGLFTDLVGAGVSGYGTYQELKNYEPQTGM